MAKYKNMSKFPIVVDASKRIILNPGEEFESDTELDLFGLALIEGIPDKVQKKVVAPLPGSRTHSEDLPTILNSKFNARFGK